MIVSVVVCVAGCTFDGILSEDTGYRIDHPFSFLNIRTRGTTSFSLIIVPIIQDSWHFHNAYMACCMGRNTVRQLTKYQYYIICPKTGKLSSFCSAWL